MINIVLLKSMVKINKWHEKFMLEVLLLYLIILERINFLQLKYYRSFREYPYKQLFRCEFNASIAVSHIDNWIAIACKQSANLVLRWL